VTVALPGSSGQADLSVDGDERLLGTILAAHAYRFLDGQPPRPWQPVGEAAVVRAGAGLIAARDRAVHAGR
jgi:hypothetical protein